MPCNQHAVLRNNLVTSIQHSMWMHVTCACLRTSLQSIENILFEKGLGGSTCLPLLLYFSKEFHWMSTTDWSLARLVTLDGVPDSSPKGPWPHRTTCHFQCHEVDECFDEFRPALLVHARDESLRILPWICSSHFIWPFWFGLILSLKSYMVILSYMLQICHIQYFTLGICLIQAP